MDADYSVELGPPSEEATLEFPWDSGLAGGPRYFDLKRRPELLSSVTETGPYPELAEFLRRVNSSASLFESAKCDVWSSDDLGADEEIYGKWKLGAYVDLVFRREDAPVRFLFSRHEEAARGLVELLKPTSEIPATCEAIVRRCYYHEPAPLPDGCRDVEGSIGREPRAGFYLSLYLFGYGEDEGEARKHWQIGLQRLAKALLQLTTR